MGIIERKALAFAQREETILNAARQLFTPSNWQTVTIDQIAEKAEIGKGTVYKHFKSKDEVYSQMVLAFLETLSARAETIPDDLDVLEKIKGFARGYWQAYLENPLMLEMMLYCDHQFVQENLSEEFTGQFVCMDNSLQNFVTGLIEEAVRQGKLEDRGASSMMIQGWGTLVGGLQLTFHFKGNGVFQTLDPEEMLESLIDFILRGWGVIESPEV